MSVGLPLAFVGLMAVRLPQFVKFRWYFVKFRHKTSTVREETSALREVSLFRYIADGLE